MCNRQKESLDHLFFMCDVAVAVWTAVTQWCGIQRGPHRWSDEREFLLSQCTTNSGKQRLYRSVVTVVVYQIWLERNSRRMQQKSRSVEVIVKYCQFVLVLCGQQDRKLARFVTQSRYL